MEEAAFERADQALTQYVKGGRTLEDIGTEFAYLRRERGLSQPDLAQRARLPLESVQAIEAVRGCRPRRSSTGWPAGWS
jgi:hypothetical protein